MIKYFVFEKVLREFPPEEYPGQFPPIKFPPSQSPRLIPPGEFLTQGIDRGELTSVELDQGHYSEV